MHGRTATFRFIDSKYADRLTPDILQRPFVLSDDTLTLFHQKAEEGIILHLVPVPENMQDQYDFLVINEDLPLVGFAKRTPPAR